MYQIYDEANNSDENKYVQSLRDDLKFKKFEEEKEVYIIFLLRLLKAYEVLKTCSNELEYFYSIVYKHPELKHFEIQSVDFHLGFFFEIVLGDPIIEAALNIVYKGLFAHQTKTFKIVEVISSLRKMLEDKCLFHEIWKQKCEEGLRSHY